MPIPQQTTKNAATPKSAVAPSKSRHRPSSTRVRVLSGTASDEPPTAPLVAPKSTPPPVKAACSFDDDSLDATDGGVGSTFAGFSTPVSRGRSTHVGESFLHSGGRHHAGILRLMRNTKKRLSCLGEEAGGEASGSIARRPIPPQGPRADEHGEEPQTSSVKRKRPMIDVVEETFAAVGLAHLQALHDHVVDADAVAPPRRERTHFRSSSHNVNGTPPLPLHNNINNNNNNNKSGGKHQQQAAHKVNKRCSTESSEFPISSPSDIQPWCSGGAVRSKFTHRPAMLKHAMPPNNLERGLAALASQHKQMTIGEKLMSWSCSSELSDVEDVNNFDEQFRQYEEDKRREMQQAKRKTSKDTIDSVMAMLNKSSDYDFAEFRAKLQAMITPQANKLGNEKDVSNLLNRDWDRERSRERGGGVGGGGGGSSSQEKPSTSSAAALLANQRRLRAAAGAETRKLRQQRDEEHRNFRLSRAKARKPHSSTPPCSTSSDNEVACYPPPSAPAVQAPPSVEDEGERDAAADPVNGVLAREEQPQVEQSVSQTSESQLSSAAPEALATPPQPSPSRLPRPVRDLERRPPSQRLIQLRLDSNEAEESKRLLLSPEKKNAIFKTSPSSYTLTLHPPVPSPERQAHSQLQLAHPQHNGSSTTNTNSNNNNNNNNNNLTNNHNSRSRNSLRLSKESKESAAEQAAEPKTVSTLSTTGSGDTVCTEGAPPRFHHQQNEFCNYLGLTGMSTANAVASAVAELADSQTMRRSLRVLRQQHQDKRLTGGDDADADDTEEAEEADEGYLEESDVRVPCTPAIVPAEKPAEIKILCHITSHSPTNKEELEQASKNCAKRLTEPIRQALMQNLRAREKTPPNEGASPPSNSTAETDVETADESAHDARAKAGDDSPAKSAPPDMQNVRGEMRYSLRSELPRTTASSPRASPSRPENIREKFHAYLEESRRTKPNIYIVEAVDNESGAQVLRQSQRQKERAAKKAPPAKKKKTVTMKLSPMYSEPGPPAQPLHSPSPSPGPSRLLRTHKCMQLQPPPAPPPSAIHAGPPKTVVKKQLRKQEVRMVAPALVLRTLRSSHSLRRCRRRSQSTLQASQGVLLAKRVSNSMLRRTKAKEHLHKLLVRQREVRQRNEAALAAAAAAVAGGGGDKRTHAAVALSQTHRKASSHRRGGKGSARSKADTPSHSNSTVHTSRDDPSLPQPSRGRAEGPDRKRRKSTTRRSGGKAKGRTAEPKAVAAPKRKLSPHRKTRSQSQPVTNAVAEDRDSSSSHISAKRCGHSTVIIPPDYEIARILTKPRLSGGAISAGGKRPPTPKKTRGTQSTFSCLRHGIRYASQSLYPMRNPLNDEQGSVLYIYYELDTLIVVQELLVSFWRCSRLLNALSPPNAPKPQWPSGRGYDAWTAHDGGETKPVAQPGEWQPLGECKRLCYDVEIPSPYANRICVNNSVPVYLEMRCRELERARRDCNLLSVYINVYFYNDDENHVKMHSVQLDAVQSLPKDVLYTTITESRYFVMAWPQENMLGKVHAGLCKYSLTPHLDTLASIREFKSMRREIVSLECTDDDKLIGLGLTELTIWDHRSGDVLMNYDLTMNLGRNLGSLFYPSREMGQNHMLLLFQYGAALPPSSANEPPPTASQTSQLSPSCPPSPLTGGGAVLSVIACSISHSTPSHRVLRRHQLPMPAFAGIKQSMNTGEHLLITGQNDEELWISCLDPTTMTLVPAQRTQRFYTRGRNQLIELSERTLIVDTFANHVLKLAANAGTFI